jgi:hypothetical protein
MSCGFCGFVRDEVIGSFAVGGPVDPFFRCPLWLQTDCRGQVLWAYNERHLDVLETYVGARLRERGHGAGLGQPTSMVERLPPWLTSAKNRHTVQRGIKRLRASLLAD